MAVSTNSSKFMSISRIITFSISIPKLVPLIILIFLLLVAASSAEILNGEPPTISVKNIIFLHSSNLSKASVNFVFNSSVE